MLTMIVGDGKPTKCVTVHVVQLFSVVFMRLRILQAAGLCTGVAQLPHSCTLQRNRNWLQPPPHTSVVTHVARKHQPSASYQTDTTEEALRYLWGREIFKCLNFLFMLSMNIAASIVYHSSTRTLRWAGLGIDEISIKVPTGNTATCSCSLYDRTCALLA